MFWLDQYLCARKYWGLRLENSVSARTDQKVLEVPGGPGLRISLAVQETWVLSLVERLRPMCLGATKAVCFN